VTPTVFNTLGQQLATLVDEDQGSGYHEVKFDGTAPESSSFRLAVSPRTPEVFIPSCNFPHK
jgi:hypothetical protein